VNKIVKAFDYVASEEEETMKTSSIIYSGILTAIFVVSGLAQQPTIPDKNKSEGTVDADKDRAGKTGHIGDGDRGGSDKTRYVGSDRFGAFEHGQLDIDKDGRISKDEFEQAFRRMDTDHDGYLSSEEFRQAGSRSMKSGGDSFNDRGRSSDPHRKADTTPKTIP
jgi:EF hand